MKAGAISRTWLEISLRSTLDKAPMAKESIFPVPDWACAIKSDPCNRYKLLICFYIIYNFYNMNMPPSKYAFMGIGDLVYVHSPPPHWSHLHQYIDTGEQRCHHQKHCIYLSERLKCSAADVPWCPLQKEEQQATEMSLGSGQVLTKRY